MVTLSGYQIESEFMPFDVFSYGRGAFLDTEKVFIQQKSPDVYVLLTGDLTVLFCT